MIYGNHVVVECNTIVNYIHKLHDCIAQAPLGAACNVLHMVIITVCKAIMVSGIAELVHTNKYVLTLNRAPRGQSPRGYPLMLF